jgi:hypothetical protein
MYVFADDMGNEMAYKLGRIVDRQRVTDGSRVLPLQFRKMDPCR